MYLRSVLEVRVGLRGRRLVFRASRGINCRLDGLVMEGGKCAWEGGKGLDYGRDGVFFAFGRVCTRFFSMSKLCSEREEWPFYTSCELRGRFLEYFGSNGHFLMESSGIIPEGDSTLLFTNAGMVQFKDYFTGVRKSSHLAVATCQKCIRINGKHDDLENVGHTIRHHSFFEMLGNFSFGAYGAEGACVLAWNFLTKVLCLPAGRLSVTVLMGDTDTARIWHEVVGLDWSRIKERGEDENFWCMDSTGPCGPCTEIYWDCIEPIDGGERFLEIWNLVFMKYFRTADGELSPLENTFIDTGMGLERLSLVVQKKKDIFDIDSMSGLLTGIRRLINEKTGHYIPNADNECSIRVIADHLKSSSFLIAEGIIPGNQGRAYVLRRLIRRSAKYSNKLGLDEPILADLFPYLLQSVQNHHPELKRWKNHIETTLNAEEAAFFANLRNGLKFLSEFFQENHVTDFASKRTIFGHDASHPLPTHGVGICPRNGAQKRTDCGVMGTAFSTNFCYNAKISPYNNPALELLYGNMKGKFVDWRVFNVGSVLAAGVLERVDAIFEMGGYGRARVVPGEVAYRLYETFGFPLDLTELVARERGWRVDGDAFERLLTKGREKCRLDSKGYFKVGEGLIPVEVLRWSERSEFCGYGRLVEPAARVINIHIESECRFWISIDPCPFYAETGGQASDGGFIEVDGREIEVLGVFNLPRDGAIALLLNGNPGGLMDCGTRVKAVVDKEVRFDIQRNHTATHLLHAALRETLGPHVVQCGSMITRSRLRFDYNHQRPMSEVELRDVEKWVFDAIERDIRVQVLHMGYHEALERRVVALFGEKYDKEGQLRVVDIPGLSSELCCGTHIENTGNIGLFKIVSQSSVSRGVRRVEAMTGKYAFRWLSDRSDTLEKASNMLKCSGKDPVALYKKIDDLIREHKSLLKEMDQLKLQLLECHEKIASPPKEPTKNYEKFEGSYGGYRLVLHSYTCNTLIDAKHLRVTSDRLRNNDQESAIHVLLTSSHILICCHNKKNTSLLKDIAKKLGIVGGGNHGLIEGKIPSDKHSTLEKIQSLINIK